MVNVAIRVENVSKFYKLYNSPGDRLREALNPFGKIYHKDFYALKNINLEIKQGEILGIVGKNGCGKSTLLKIIAGVLYPNSGQVTVNGKISALLELGSGFNPEFTGFQNVFFYGTILGFSKVEMEEKLSGILAFAEIGDFIDQPLKTYSSGMKARLGFAIAVAVDPDILIVDEVLAVGDILFQRKCYNKIHELFSNGKTVIFVSHNSQLVTQFCNRVILLQDGNVISDGRPKDILVLYEKMLFSQLNTVNVVEDLNHDKSLNMPSNLNAEDNEISGPAPSNEHLGRMYDIFLYDSENDIVSMLSRDEFYTIEFKVKYSCSFNEVSPGVQISNMQGFLVSGANLWGYQGENVPYVKADEIVKVRWRFKCLLVPGVYTVALSSTSKSSKEVIKLADALIFKVLPDKKINGGVVGLEQEIAVEMMGIEQES